MNGRLNASAHHVSPPACLRRPVRLWLLRSSRICSCSLLSTITSSKRKRLPDSVGSASHQVGQGPIRPSHTVELLAKGPKGLTGSVKSLTVGGGVMSKISVYYTVPCGRRGKREWVTECTATPCLVRSRVPDLSVRMGGRDRRVRCIFWKDPHPRKARLVQSSGRLRDLPRKEQNRVR